MYLPHYSKLYLRRWFCFTGLSYFVLTRNRLKRLSLWLPPLVFPFQSISV
jgi:hypothetical protein